MRAFLAATLLVGLGCAGTPTGAKIDDQCIAGRLSKEGAAYLNDNPDAWQKIHGDYTARIEKNDRVLSRDCSEALIALGAGDFEALDEALKRMKKNDD